MNTCVSVIIPSFNHEKFILDCLDSLSAQTYDNLDVIVCDDCSSDKTYEILIENKDKYSAVFSSFTVLKNEMNMGITHSLNRMLKIAKGEYIKIIASDDMFTKDAIREYVACFEKNKDISVIVSDGIVVEEESSYLEIKECRRFFNEKPTYSDFYNDIYIENKVFAPGMIMKKSVYDNYGMYDESIIIEDMEYNIRLAVNGIKHFFLDKPLIYYRMNSNSSTSVIKNKNYTKRIGKKYDAQKRILEKYKDDVDSGMYEYKKYLIIKESINSFDREDDIELYNIMKKDLKSIKLLKMKPRNAWRCLKLKLKA